LAVIGYEFHVGGGAEGGNEGLDVVGGGLPVQVAQSNLVNLGHLK